MIFLSSSDNEDFLDTRIRRNSQSHAFIENNTRHITNLQRYSFGLTLDSNRQPRKLSLPLKKEKKIN